MRIFLFILGFFLFISSSVAWLQLSTLGMDVFAFYQWKNLITLLIEYPSSYAPFVPKVLGALGLPVFGLFFMILAGLLPASSRSVSVKEIYYEDEEDSYEESSSGKKSKKSFFSRFSKNKGSSDSEKDLSRNDVPEFDYSSYSGEEREFLEEMSRDSKSDSKSDSKEDIKQNSSGSKKSDDFVAEKITVSSESSYRETNIPEKFSFLKSLFLKPLDKENTTSVSSSVTIEPVDVKKKSFFTRFNAGIDFITSKFSSLSSRSSSGKLFGKSPRPEEGILVFEDAPEETSYSYNDFEREAIMWNTARNMGGRSPSIREKGAALYKIYSENKSVFNEKFMASHGMTGFAIISALESYKNISDKTAEESSGESSSSRVETEDYVVDSDDQDNQGEDSDQDLDDNEDFNEDNNEEDQDDDDIDKKDSSYFGDDEETISLVGVDDDEEINISGKTKNNTFSRFEDQDDKSDVSEEDNSESVDFSDPDEDDEDSGNPEYYDEEESSSDHLADPSENSEDDFFDDYNKKQKALKNNQNQQNQQNEDYSIETPFDSQSDRLRAAALSEMNSGEFNQEKNKNNNSGNSDNSKDSDSSESYLSIQDDIADEILSRTVSEDFVQKPFTRVMVKSSSGKVLDSDDVFSPNETKSEFENIKSDNTKSLLRSEQIAVSKLLASSEGKSSEKSFVQEPSDGSSSNILMFGEEDFSETFLKDSELGESLDKEKLSRILGEKKSSSIDVDYLLNLRKYGLDGMTQKHPLLILLWENLMRVIEYQSYLFGWKNFGETIPSFMEKADDREKYLIKTITSILMIRDEIPESVLKELCELKSGTDHISWLTSRADKIMNALGSEANRSRLKALAKNTGDSDTGNILLNNLLGKESYDIPYHDLKILTSDADTGISLSNRYFSEYKTKWQIQDNDLQIFFGLYLAFKREMSESVQNSLKNSSDQNMSDENKIISMYIDTSFGNYRSIGKDSNYKGFLGFVFIPVPKGRWKLDVIPGVTEYSDSVDMTQDKYFLRGLDSRYGEGLKLRDSTLYRFSQWCTSRDSLCKSVLVLLPEEGAVLENLEMMRSLDPSFGESPFEIITGFPREDQFKTWLREYVSNKPA